MNHNKNHRGNQKHFDINENKTTTYAKFWKVVEKCLEGNQ